MRGELRTTNSFGGRREGTSEGAAAIRFVMKEVLHSLFRSSVRPLFPSAAGDRELNRWRMEVSLDVSNIRYQSTIFGSDSTHLPLPFSMLLFLYPLPLVPISPHAVAMPCHHFVTRITACLLAELPGFLRNTAAPPLSTIDRWRKRIIPHSFFSSSALRPNPLPSPLVARSCLPVSS